MITMRLMRIGAKKRPSYRIVVMDSKKARQSEALDTLGYYSPVEDPVGLKLDVEKANRWLSKGAQPSRTVQSLLNKISPPKKPTQDTLS